VCDKQSVSRPQRGPLICSPLDWKQRLSCSAATSGEEHVPEVGDFCFEFCDSTSGVAWLVRSSLNYSAFQGESASMAAISADDRAASRFCLCPGFAS
jgi:hypothetical protein